MMMTTTANRRTPQAATQRQNTAPRHVEDRAWQYISRMPRANPDEATGAVALQPRVVGCEVRSSTSKGHWSFNATPDAL